MSFLSEKKQQMISKCVPHGYRLSRPSWQAHNFALKMLSLSSDVYIVIFTFTQNVMKWHVEGIPPRMINAM